MEKGESREAPEARAVNSLHEHSQQPGTARPACVQRLCVSTGVVTSMLPFCRAPTPAPEPCL